MLANHMKLYTFCGLVLREAFYLCAPSAGAFFWVKGSPAWFWASLSRGPPALRLGLRPSVTGVER